MRDGLKSRQTVPHPSNRPSDELREETLEVRLRRIAEDQSRKAIEELERREETRRLAARER